MPAKKFSVKLTVKNPKLANEFSNIIDKKKEFDIVINGEMHHQNLLIHELGNDYKEDLKKLQLVLDQSENTEIFLVSERSDPEILIEALRIGVKEFLPLPLELEAVQEALDRFKIRYEKIDRKKTGTLGKIYSFVGSKGGVGTTTVGVNLAVGIASTEQKPSVVLLDMNILFGDIPIFLDMSPKHNWNDITKNIERLDEFFLSNVLSEHPSGVHVLPSPRYLDNHPSPTPPIIEMLLDLMKKMYDFIIIDMGQSLNETALKIIQMSDLVHLVAIQSLPCLSNANRLMKSILDYGYSDRENVKIVLNRYFKKGMVSLENAEEGVGKKFSWIIPNDYPTTMSAINSGVPLCQIAPKSNIVKNYNEYVEKLLPGEAEKKKKGWFF